MGSETSQPEGEAAVRALYSQLMDGWNKGSGEAFAAPFAENGHLIGFDGTHFTRRDEIVSFQQPLFDTWLKETRLVGEVQSVRFLSPDVALMHATRRDRDARKIATLVGAGLDSNARRCEARRRMAPRCVSEYESQAYGPERSEYFPVVDYGLAVEGVRCEEIDRPALC